MVGQGHFEGTRHDNAAALFRRHDRIGHQRGVFAPMTAVFLVLIFTLCAMALGLSQLYNRKVELQAVASSVALAAARELNGSDAGVALALQKAATTAERFTYNYQEPIVWSDSAISFASSADGEWVSAGGGDAKKMFYVKVDTAKLGGSTGLVAPVFAQFLPSANAVEVSSSAVAGRVGVTVVPLAICALSSVPGAPRGLELLEYGFRRGIPYNLLHLNPGGPNPEHFVIDPLVAPGASATGHNTSPAVVGPFVCTGKMWMPRVTGGEIQVSRPFPIGSLYQQFNSRFDQYPGGLCSPNGAPPDFNVRAFTGTWMKPNQTAPFVTPFQGANELLTVAERSAPGGTQPEMWGALWSYAKAVKYSSYQAGQPEPQPPLAGYATFSASPDFLTLYHPGLTAPSYPNSLAGGTPYRSSVTNPPTNRRLAEENRRVLNVPLLACPVAPGAHVKAEVLAVGKFFMTEPATATRIVGEFAGIAPAQTLVDQVELFK
ncbi:MAG: pilus assembly protein TadG-related protein [Pseudomonadota bacterium]